MISRAEKVNVALMRRRGASQSQPVALTFLVRAVAVLTMCIACTYAYASKRGASQSQPAPRLIILTPMLERSPTCCAAVRQEAY